MFIGEVVDTLESGHVVSTIVVGQEGQEGGIGQGVQVVTVGHEGDAGQGVHSGQVGVTQAGQ